MHIVFLNPFSVKRYRLILVFAASVSPISRENHHANFLASQYQIPEYALHIPIESATEHCAHPEQEWLCPVCRSYFAVNQNHQDSLFPTE